MLVYQVRDTTIDVDFIPSKTEFVVRAEYRAIRAIVNKDVLNIQELSLNFKKLRPYFFHVLAFGNLRVHLTDYDLLLAMKVAARGRRMVSRDAEDIKWLDQRADRKRAFEAYKLITKLLPDFDDWSNDIDTELFMINAGGEFTARQFLIYKGTSVPSWHTLNQAK